MVIIQDVLGTEPETILRRGEDYYNSDSILSLSKSSEGVFTGKVSGSGGETYKVRVQADAEGEACRR